MSDQMPQAVQTPAGPDQLYLATRSYVEFLQFLFAEWEEFQWAADPKTSKIRIITEFPYAPTEADKRPALVVLRSPAAWKALSSNQTMAGGDPFADRSSVHADIMDSAITILALAGLPAEASRMGWYIFKAIPAARVILQRMPGVGSVLNRVQISQPMDAVRTGWVQGAPAGSWYGVQVVSPYTINEETVFKNHPHLANAMKNLAVRVMPPGTPGRRPVI